MNLNLPELSGSCLCGTVQHAVLARPELAEYCHCAMCRKTHGAAFSTNAAIPAAAFEIRQGRNAILAYRSSPRRERCFCGQCGSSLFIRRLGEPERVVLHLGGLAGDATLRPARHVFVGSKAPWHTITDALPQYPVYPGFEAQTATAAVAPQAQIRGSCLCAQVGFELDGGALFLNHCHCSMCRRFTGSAFGSFLHADGERFAWSRGSEHVRRYESSPGNWRAFCGHCGGKLPVLEDEGTHAIVPAGAIDGDPGLAAIAHFFVAHRAPWYVIGDAVPQYEEFPPEAFWASWD